MWHTLHNKHSSNMGAVYVMQVLPKEETGGGELRFAAPPNAWRPWDPVQIAVGNLPVFSQVLGDGRAPFEGPAVLLGLDVLSQRRVILETTGKGRRRRLFIGTSS